MKTNKSIRDQKKLIDETIETLRPILEDESVTDSTKRRIQFCLDVSNPTYFPEIKEVSVEKIDRLGNMIGGWPFTSNELPWPHHDGKPIPPFLQLNLEDLSKISKVDFGKGLLQVWANHAHNEIRVVSGEQMHEAQTDVYFDTGIIDHSNDEEAYEELNFDVKPLAKRNAQVTKFGSPKPTIIPEFELCSRYNLDDEGLDEKYLPLLQEALSKLARYFPGYRDQFYFFGALQFRQCYYDPYIELCVAKKWSPLAQFSADDNFFEFTYDGQAYLLYRQIDQEFEFMFYWDR